MSIIIKSGSSGNLANVDALGNLYAVTSPAAIPAVAAPWTNATLVNSVIPLVSTGGFEATTVAINQTSTITGGAVVFEGTYDGINWQTLPSGYVLDPVVFTSLSSTYNLQANINTAFLIITGSFQQTRVRLSTVISGTGSVTIYTLLLSKNPQSADNIVVVSGVVATDITQVGGASLTLGQAVMSGSIPVTLASNQTSVPVTLASTTVTGTVAVTQSTSPWTVNGAVTANAGTGNFGINHTQYAGSSLTGTVTAYGTAPTGNVFGVNANVTNTVTVSGTLAATQSGTWSNSIIQGGNTATVKAASTAATTADPALVVAISPNNTVAVTGTFWQATQPVSGTVSVNALPTGSNTIGAVTISGTPAVTVSGSVAVTGTFWQATQPVSGTVTANAGTGSFTVAQGTAANLNATVVGTGTFAVQAACTQTTSPWVTSDSNALTQGSTTSSQKGFLEFGAVTTSAPTYTTAQSSPLSLDTSGNLRTSVNNTVAVSGTFWQATQPVSGTITANAGTGTFTVQDGADMSGTAAGTAPNYTSIVGGKYNSSTPSPTNGQTLPLQLDSSGRLIVNVAAGASGNAAASATGSAVPASADYIGFSNAGNLVGVSSSNPLPVTVENSSIAVTGTFWQATQPVSGTVTANAGTGSFTVAQGTAANLNATVVGTGTFAVQAACTQTTSPWITSDSNALTQGSTTSSQKGFLEFGAVTTSAPTYTTAQSSPLSLDTSGNLRTSVNNTVAVSGTFWQTTQPVSGTVSVNSLPSGSNTIGAVTISGTPTVSVSGSVSVTGTFWQATQPVSAASLPLPSNAAQETGGNLATLAGTVTSSKVQVNVTNSSIPVTGTFWQTTQPVSGTVTANQGTSPWITQDEASVAQASTTSGQNGVLIQGATTTSAPTYTTAKTNPLSLDTSGNLRTSVNNTVAVSGTFWQTTQPVSGTVSVNALPTGSNTIGAVTISGTPAVSISGSVAVTGTFWQTTQPVSGTVTANAGTGTFTTQDKSSSSTASTAPTTAIEAGLIAATSYPTAVTNGQLVGAMGDKAGRLVTVACAPRDLVSQQATTITSSTTATTVVTAGGTGVYNDITSLTITNSSSTALIVTLNDGTVPYIFALAANGGMVNNFSTPFKATNTATAWTLTCGTSVASIYVVIQYVSNR